MSPLLVEDNNFYASFHLLTVPGVRICKSQTDTIKSEKKGDRLLNLMFSFLLLLNTVVLENKAIRWHPNTALFGVWSRGGGICCKHNCINRQNVKKIKLCNRKLTNIIWINQHLVRVLKKTKIYISSVLVFDGN